ncbi:hypothetical protein LTR84_008934 [Exophiala bonariae]|uniref:Uncharacterized protein n=1 Tax=Exophiala bonariae TaxID=1690606 RepID=A0AAV9MZ75_9EURO|nr:hypothetical protein LTR84_008934 [Exophiala bonariae]
MQSHFFGPLKASNQLRPIESVIQFLPSKNFGAPNSWVSYVDTGIVEVIQRSGALALGLSTETGGNPGSVLWRDVFVAQRDGTFANRHDHDYARGLAEATATEWAKSSKADVLAAVPATRQKLNWHQFTIPVPLDHPARARDDSAAHARLPLQGRRLGRLVDRRHAE